MAVAALGTSVKIRANKQPGATIKDVARKAEVSAMTVSRVLNGEPNVRPATRERVQAAIGELNYRPNLSARNLARANTCFIGLLYDNPSAGYSSELLIGALNQCRKLGYHLVLESCGGSETERVEAVENLLGSSQFHGLIIPPPLCDRPELLATVEAAGIPFVRIAPHVDRERGMCVSTDDRAAARRMTEHLIQLGHRRIGFIKGPKDHGASHERYEGYRDALAAAAIDPDDALVVEGRFTYRSGLECAERLLGLRVRPTAIFASNDDMAAAVVALAHKYNLEIPGDLSVAGFDDTHTAVTVWPQLTTVRQPIPEMAARAVEILADLLDERPQEPGADPATQIRSTVIKRASSAAPAR